MPDSIRRFQYRGKDSLLLPAERDAFTVLKEWLSGIASELALPDRMRKQLLISADEIFTNIALYGYPGTEGLTKIAVEFNLAERELTLIFTDTGKAYNPITARTPETTKPLSERSAGGLGIFLVKKLMDSVEYRHENNQNILVLKKCLPEAKG